jgi:HEAT repeat protein
MGILTTLLILLVLAACGKNPTPPLPSSGKGPGLSTPAGADPAEATRRLIVRLGHRDPQARKLAGQALVRQGTRALPLLHAAAKTGEATLRTRIFDVLGRIGDPQSVELIAGSLGHEDAGVRMTAAQALGRIGAGRAAGPLKTALEDADEDVRALAAEALGRCGSAGDLPVLVRALSDSASEVRLSAAEALGFLGESAARVPLEGCLGDEDHRVRFHAAEALGKLKDPASVPALGRALRDSDDRTRFHAARALGWIKHASAGPALEKAREEEEVPWVRLGIAFGIFRSTGEREALSDLTGALRSPDWTLRPVAAELLGHTDEAAAVEPLVDALAEAEREEVRITEALEFFRYAPAALKSLTGEDFGSSAARWRRWLARERERREK